MCGLRVSPGVNPRPSLNVFCRSDLPVPSTPGGVAGGEPPALIERLRPGSESAIRRKGVAGGEPPALIERAEGLDATAGSWCACRRG